MKIDLILTLKRLNKDAADFEGFVGLEADVAWPPESVGELGIRDVNFYKAQGVGSCEFYLTGLFVGTGFIFADDNFGIA